MYRPPASPAHCRSASPLVLRSGSTERAALTLTTASHGLCLWRRGDLEMDQTRSKKRQAEQRHGWLRRPGGQAEPQPGPDE